MQQLLERRIFVVVPYSTMAKAVLVYDITNFVDALYPWEASGPGTPAADFIAFDKAIKWALARSDGKWECVDDDDDDPVCPVRPPLRAPVLIVEREIGWDSPDRIVAGPALARSGILGVVENDSIIGTVTYQKHQPVKIHLRQPVEAIATLQSQNSLIQRLDGEQSNYQDQHTQGIEWSVVEHGNTMYHWFSKPGSSTAELELKRWTGVNVNEAVKVGALRTHQLENDLNLPSWVPATTIALDKTVDFVPVVAAALDCLNQMIINRMSKSGQQLDGIGKLSTTRYDCKGPFQVAHPVID